MSRMLNIYYGNMKESVYNTAAYFKYDYEDSWIVDSIEEGWCDENTFL